MEAIREAVTNAIIHRDYSIIGSDIKVAIFDDMLEITSPGPLPENLPPDALGTGRSEIRNRVLAPIFKELKLIEAWGTGIQKMRTEVANYPDIRLVLQEAGHAFQVQFVKTRAQEAQVKAHEAQEATEETQEVLSKVERDILAACQINDQSGRELLAKTGYTTRTGNFKNTLTRLLERGLVEMTIPDKPRSSKQRYRLTEKGRAALSKRRKL